MKQLNSYLAIALFAVVFLASCAKDNQEAAQQVVSQDVLQKIASLGFSTNEVQVIDEGYLVEGDIVLTAADIDRAPSSVLLRIAETEQYSTFELVTGTPRTITVSVNGSTQGNILPAVQAACARYNSENLGLTFNYIGTGGGGNINVTVVNGGGFIASAGFPSGGNPYSNINFNRQYRNWNVNTLATVFAHEIGHCIGFRHTDYMNRSFSCGTGGNEGQETNGVGAVHIPGTPTGPDAASWMLACIGNGQNRPFNPNDKTALGFLY